MQSKLSNDTNMSTQRGLQEVTVIVNRTGAHRRKRFIGQLLVRWLQPTNNEEGTEVLCVYITAGKQYALHSRTVPDWDCSEGDPDYWGNPKNWGVGNGLLQKLLQVYKTLEDLKAHVSDDLYKAVNESMEGLEIEELDI